MLPVRQTKVHLISFSLMLCLTFSLCCAAGTILSGGDRGMALFYSVLTPKRTPYTEIWQRDTKRAKMLAMDGECFCATQPSVRKMWCRFASSCTCRTFTCNLHNCCMSLELTANTRCILSLERKRRKHKTSWNFTMQNFKHIKCTKMKKRFTKSETPNNNRQPNCFWNSPLRGERTPHTRVIATQLCQVESES